MFPPPPAQHTVCCVDTVHRARHQNGDAGAAGRQGLPGAQGTCITCQLASRECRMDHHGDLLNMRHCTRSQQSSFSGMNRSAPSMCCWGWSGRRWTPQLQIGPSKRVCGRQQTCPQHALGRATTDSASIQRQSVTPTPGCGQMTCLPSTGR